MHLDVPTLVAMGSFVAGCAGLLLLVAWSQNRKITILALWGAAEIIAAGGIACLMFLMISRRPVWSFLAGGLLALSPGLMWKAARNFDAKQAPLVIALLGLILVVITWGIPDLPDIGGTLSLAASIAYLLAGAASLWLGRAERLAARWPLGMLMVVHASVLSLGLYSTLDGGLRQQQVPSVMSLFGIIHFESIIFAVGTAVFLFALVKERNEAESRVAARIDPLTGVANRRAFMESADRIVACCRLENAPVCAMMFDLDRFKTINDTYGHAVGDAVIRNFCKVVTGMLRPNDVFGRSGGEEFVAVLPRSDIDAAFVRAERIRIAFAESCRFVGAHRVDATVSGGVSVSPQATDTLAELLEHSDKALYRAKADGRNRIRRAEPSMPMPGSSTVIRVA